MWLGPLVINTILLLLIVTKQANATDSYQPNWKSLDSRPLPPWYDESKLGIFIHWGVFSVPSFGSEWFWDYWKSGKPEYEKFMIDNYSPSFTYQDFAHDFDAYFFDPGWWSELIESSGAKYVVITTKHHEGFTLWPSNVSFSWNAKDVGPNRDLIGDFAAAIKKTNSVKFGVYHSLFEWFNPLHTYDQRNNFTTDRFVVTKTLPELYELVNTYHPEIVWSDGDEGPPPSYWKSMDFLAWLYNESPVKDTVVTNDRWGEGAACHHGGYWTCSDRYTPGSVIHHKWENCFTLDKVSWGYRRNAALNDYLSDHEIISTLAQTVSYGGNLLLNMGPRKDGRIDPLMEERLRNLGKWMRINGEAIYSTKPWLHQNDTNGSIWYTSKIIDSSFCVYAVMLTWPINDSLILSNIKASKGLQISLLGYTKSYIPWKYIHGELHIDLSLVSFSDMPSYEAWAFKFQNLDVDLQSFHPLVV